MSKRFIHSINYMRGLCMLGVIAIHVGSVAIVNPSPNLGLVAILEILSRFSRRAGQLFLRLDGLALAAVRSAGFLRRCLGEGGHPLWLVLPAVRLYCVSAGCAPYAVVCYELAPDRDRHHRGGPGNGSQPSPRASA